RKCLNLVSAKRKISRRLGCLVVAQFTCLLNGWIGENAMSGLYEEVRDLLNEEKGVALATVVRGEEHVGAKLLVYPDKSTHGSLGNAALEALVVEDAERAIWTGD